MSAKAATVIMLVMTVPALPRVLRLFRNQHAGSAVLMVATVVVVGAFCAFVFWDSERRS